MFQLKFRNVSIPIDLGFTENDIVPIENTVFSKKYFVASSIDLYVFEKFVTALGDSSNFFARGSKCEEWSAVQPFRASMPINNLARTACRSLPTGSTVHSVSLNISVHKQTPMHMCTCITRTNGTNVSIRDAWNLDAALSLSLCFFLADVATGRKWTSTCVKEFEKKKERRKIEHERRKCLQCVLKVFVRLTMI